MNAAAAYDRCIRGHGGIAGDRHIGAVDADDRSINADDAFALRRDLTGSHTILISVGRELYLCGADGGNAARSDMQRGVIAVCIHAQPPVDLDLTGGNFATAPGIQITIVCDGIPIIGVTVNLQSAAFGRKSPAVTTEAVIPIQQLGHIVAVDDEPYAVSKLIRLAPAGIKRDNAILICRVCANNIISGSDKLPSTVFPAGEQIAVLAVAGNIFTANPHRRSEIFVIWRTGIEQIRIEIALAAIAVKQNGVVSINGLVDFTGSGCFSYFMKPLVVICPTNQFV